MENNINTNNWTFYVNESLQLNEVGQRLTFEEQTDVLKYAINSLQHTKKQSNPSGFNMIKFLNQNLITYDGSKSPDKLNDFCDRMDSLIHELYGTENTPFDEITIVTSKLVGHAKIWWRRHCEDYPCLTSGTYMPGRYTSWDSLKSALIKDFMPSDVITKARNQLAKLTQKSTVRQLAEQFTKLELRIPNLSNDEKSDRFIRCLKPHIYFTLANRTNIRDTNFVDLVRIAIEVEEDLNAFKNSDKSSAYSQNYSSSKPNVTRFNPDAMDVSSVSYGKQLNYQEKRYLRNNKGCFYCRETNTNHQANNCPKRTQTQPLQDNEQNNNIHLTEIIKKKALCLSFKKSLNLAKLNLNLVN
jgi:hypothetical protein